MKILLFLVVAISMVGCDMPAASEPSSTTGVRKATAKIQVQASGLTIEQENVQRRLQEDNKPGSLKHLYVISAMSGDVLLYSTVKGKVTSSGKRLTPTSVSAADGQYVDGDFGGFAINIGGTTKRTSEVLQDDGTYGSSVEYIYWWDSKSVYHQHYVTGGQIVHVSNAPMRVGKVIINVDSAVE
jgi:hypothetical protein